MYDIVIETYERNSILDIYLNNIDKDSMYFVSKNEEKVICIASIKYLNWDSEIFNKKIGLLSNDYGELSKDILNEIDQFCMKNKYECLFTKASTVEYEKMHLLEDFRFNIMDSIITLKIKIKNRLNDNEDFEFKSRILGKSDLSRILDLIDNLYSFGRFFEDPNLDNNDVNILYKKWITNEINNENIDVIGIEYKNKLVGFISCKYRTSKNDDEIEGVISLVGIDKNYQGLGIGKKLMNYVLSNFYDKGIEIVYVGTQIDNISALNLYISTGFRIENSVNSFHKNYNY